MSAHHTGSFNLFQQLLRQLVFGLIRLFYPRIEVHGREKLPAGGVLLLANHPNGLIDPAIMIIGLDLQAAFLAKSTLFGNPAGRAIMRTFGALPIFRSIDSGKPGGPQGDMRDRNEETFGQCRQILNDGGAVALFPEGTTHSNTQMLPLRSGAARVALGAEAEAGWPGQIHVAPVGLWYEAKTIFRSAVLIVVGDPVAVGVYQAAFAEDPFTAARQLTRRIRTALDAVVLQAEDYEVLRAIPVVADWIAPLPEAGRMQSQYDWSKRLLAAYRIMRRKDPERMEILAADLRHYADSLRRLGLKRPFDPGTLERSLRRIGLRFAWLVVLFPLALAGFLTTYPTYRLARPFAHLVVPRDRTQISTVKLLGGMIFVGIGWIVEAVLVGQALGPLWGWLFLAGVPLCAYLALVWGERMEALAEIVARHGRLLFARDRVRRLRAQREQLAREILDAVREAEAPVHQAGG